MNRLYKTTLLFKLFIVSILSTMAFLFGILPCTAQAFNLTNTPLPESTPGNFAVTWYSCRRYFPGQEPGAAHAGEIFNNLLYSPVDKDKSDAALQSWDTSNCTGQGHMSDLTFDMKNWQPDTQYWSNFKSEYNWNWCEVDGFIKLPDDLHMDDYEKENNDYYMYSVSADPQRSDVACDLQIAGNGSLPSGVFVPFRLRIQCHEPDQNNLKTGFSIVFNYGANLNGSLDNWSDFATKTGHLPGENIYGTLALKDMQPYFQLDTKNYTVYLDPKYCSFPVKDYEYGYAGGTSFKPLAFGTNYLKPDSGDVIVRYKLIDDPKWGWMYSNWYITLGTISLPAPGQLLVTGRAPTTASLAWSTPAGDTPPTTYDIYRQKVDAMIGFFPNAVFTVDNTVQKVGSTSGLNFTDQGLSYDVVYAYYVKANYSTGNSTASNTVRTDSVTMQGLPPTPSNLRIKIQSQSTLTLNWTCPQATPGIKEYVVYRSTSYHSLTTPPTPPGGGPSNVISSIMQVTPSEIGRSTTTSFNDSGLTLYDQCEYYVQAVDENGIPSLISGPVKVSISDVTPPTMPDELQAGDILRQGDSVQYAFPDESGIRNVILGPKREIALRWDPSTDNVGVAAYNIYRSASGANYSTNDIFWGEKEHLVGSTKDNFFIDSGLEFGATYTYYVEAVDAVGNVSGNWVSIGTEKSTLAGLAISNGSQLLTPDPAFAYYQAEYTLNVDNTVKSISLTPTRTDPYAQVMVNGAPVYNDESDGPLALDPGKNIITVEVVPRRGAEWFIEPETMRYTLAVNRANLDNLPVLTLPEDGTVLNEGDTYKAVGKIVIPNNLVWTGTADYGDGTGEKPLQLNADGSFSLEHKYLDNGQYKIKVNFRYEDLGLVKGTVEVTVQNVAPVLTVQGIQDDEITTPEGALLTITGNIIDPGEPGHDSWAVTGDYGSEWGPTPAIVKEDKTFIFQDTFYDLKPEYDLVLKVVDKDGGSFSKHIKIKVENVAPSIQAGGSSLVLRGVAFTRTGSFADPGLETWQATVDYGDGSGQQPLTLNYKAFDLNHVYLKTGSFTVTVRVEDSNGGTGSASFPVKVKDYLFTIEAAADISINEGDKLERDVPVQGRRDKIESITVDYGDGAGEGAVSLSTNSGAQSGMVDQKIDSLTGGLIGIIQLQHVYSKYGTYKVQMKIVDVDGDSCENSFQVKVANVPPTVQLEPIADIYTGNSCTVSGRITDPGADTWTVGIDFRDYSTPCKVSVNSDKTFSVKHTYILSGIFDIEAVVRDDGGGFGRASQKVQVMTQGGGGGGVASSVYHDASLHALFFTGDTPLRQNDGAYTGTGFTPECHHYTISGSMDILQIEVAADNSATIKYTNGGAAMDLLQGTPTWVDMVSPLTIVVTAADGVTTCTYTINTFD